MQNLIAAGTRHIDLAAAYIWASVAADASEGVSAKTICLALEHAGTRPINQTRLREAMAGERRFVRDRGGTFRISPKERARLNEQFVELKEPDPAPDSGTILPVEIFANARKYVQAVVRQINLSFDYGLFDCCAVMCRRLFETLIIEAFEKQGALSELKRPDGELDQLSGLIRALESTTTFSVGRQTKQAAKKLKDVGDWSAHNRRHVAVAKDIEDVKSHLRVACGDLLHLAGQD
ncbi:hypothetical protein [Allosphingosinicella sp.]|uniref:hypothetical protein n=1 Tax=Allosphingosinicella sp. TaxID=2823234 RepID=UPI003783AADC